MMSDSVFTMETCYVNFTYECFYQVFPSERRVVFMICTEDEEPFMGSFIASETFLQFIRERLYPLRKTAFDELYNQVSHTSNTIV